MEQLQSWFQDTPDYVEYSPIFPNPVICMRDMIKIVFIESHRHLPVSGMRVWLQETADWMRLSTFFDWGIILYSLILAVCLTLLRIVLNRLLFFKVPGWYKLNREATEKFPESIWKCSIYIFTWSWAIYLVLFGETNLFTDLVAHWNNWYPGNPLSTSLYCLYVFQIAFYLHCAYASVYIETIRKDFFVLMLHHVLTIGLLLLSYCIRFHIIGLLVLFLQDVGDIFLELSKTLNYFKIQDGKEKWIPEMCANISFAIFTIQHVLFRLYWFLTKVIYSAMYVSVVFYPGAPFWLLFTVLLWALWGMQVYWFKFIVRLLVKILIYKEKLEDTREFEEEEEQKSKKEEQNRKPDGKKGDVRKEDGRKTGREGRKKEEKKKR